MQANPALATAIMAWQLEHHQTLCHNVVDWYVFHSLHFVQHSPVVLNVQQAKNDKLTAEVAELKQKLDAKEHHHHHKKHKHPHTLAAEADKDPLMQDPSEKKA